MATRLYFRDLAWTGANNPPRVLFSSAPNDVVVTGGLTSPRKMLAVPGTSQKALTAATLATTNPQTRLYATFVSDPLVAQSVRFPGDVIVSVADSETNLNANHYINNAAIFLFRPSTGVKVGDIRFSQTSVPYAGSGEPTAAASIQTTYGRITTSAITELLAEQGDVIVVQIGADFVQGMGTAYSASFYYDGAVVTTTENTVVTNHASFVEFPWDLQFVGGSAALAASVSAVSSASATFMAGTALSGAAAAEVSSAGALTSTPPWVGGATTSALGSGDLTVYDRLVYGREWLWPTPREVSTSARGLLIQGPGSTVFMSQASGTSASRLATSTDGGQTWTPDTVWQDMPWDFGAVNSAGVLVLVQETYGTLGRAVSPYIDSLVLTAPPANESRYEIAANGAQFSVLVFVDGGLAVGNCFYVDYGNNGSSWTRTPQIPQLGKYDNLSGFGYCGSRISVFREGTPYSMVPGAGSWTAGTMPPVTGFREWLSPVTFGGVHYSASKDTGQVISSTDGINWVLVATLPIKPTVWDGRLLVANGFLVATFGQEVFFVSRDGKSWTARGGFLSGSSLPLANSTGMWQMQGSTDGVGANHTLTSIALSETMVGYAYCVATASATDLFLDPTKKPALAKCVASATGLLRASQTVLSGQASAASSLPRDLVVAVTNGTVGIGAGKNAYDPVLDIAISPTRRLLPQTDWQVLPPPDGTNTPVFVAASGTGMLAAYSSVGPNVRVSTDAITWTNTGTITAPPGGWGAVVEIALVGGNGRFLLAARVSDTQWYSWVSTGGAWSAPVALPPIAVVSNTYGYTGLSLFASPDGFVGVQPQASTAKGVKVFWSATGATWTEYFLNTGVFDTNFYPSGSGSGGRVAYSGGYLLIPRIDGFNNAVVLDLRDLVAGGTGNAAGLVLAYSFPFGDPWAVAPTFYKADSVGIYATEFRTTSTYATWTRWASSTLYFTGDYAVFSGRFFGRVLRVGDLVNFSGYTPVGPSLRFTEVTLSGSAGAASTATGRLPTTHALSGTPSVAATASGVLTVRMSIAASAAVQASATALLQVPQKFDAVVSAQATASAGLTTLIRLTAAVSASASASAPVTTSIRLAATPAVSSSAAATTILVPKPLAAAGQGTATASGALTVPIFLAGAAQAQVGATGSIATTALLVASLTASAAANADLTVGSNFRGSGVAETSLDASLNTQIILASAATSAAEATAALLTQISLGSALTAESISEAGLSTSIDLHALVQAVVQAHGALRRLVPADARAMPLRATSVATTLTARLVEQSVTHRDAPDAAVARPTQSVARHTDAETTMVSTTTEQPAF